jgi:hypothetical protein
MQHYKLRMQQLNVLSKTKLATIFEESNQENYDIKLYNIFSRRMENR